MLVPALILTAGIAGPTSAATVYDLLANWKQARIENQAGESRVRISSSGGVPRRAVQLHPTEKRATAFFDIPIPPTAPDHRIVLTAFLGLDDGIDRADKAHPIDGVRFFVDVDGLTVLSLDRVEPGWTPLSIDLTKHAGRSIRIAFAVDKKENANYDWAQIAEPRITRLVGAGTPISTIATPVQQGLIEIRSPRADTVLLQPLKSGTPTGPPIQVEVRAGVSSYRTVDRRLGSYDALRLQTNGAAAAYYPFQPRLRLASISTSVGLVSPGQPFEIRATVRNEGEGAYVRRSAALSVSKPKGVVITDPADRRVGSIEPGEQTTVLWAAKGTRSEDVTTMVNLSGEHPDAALLLVPTADAAPTIPKAGLAAGAIGHAAYVQNEAIRIVFQPSSIGTAMRVFSRSGSAWEQVATSNQVSLLVSNGSGAPPRHFPFRISRTTTSVENSAAVLTLRGERSDIWGAELRCTILKGSLSASLHFKATARTAADIYALRFPYLKVGDGQGGSSKDGALFPGLEYLLKDEPSSDTRFASPPLHNRTSPHRYKVTMPFMSVRRNGAGVSLVWNPTQQWTNGFTVPTAMFSSPNRLEQQDNHLMSLWAPGVRSVDEENIFPTDKPAYISAGASISLSADIVVQAKSNSLLNIVEWYIKNRGLPNPPQTGRRGQAAIDLALQGLTGNYIPEQKAWNHTNTGPVFFDPLVALSLHVGAILTANEELRRKAVAQVRDSVASAGVASAGDLAFHLGDIEPALARMRAEAISLMNSQRADGSWEWTPPSDRHRVFGTAGDTSSGVVGRNAAALWKYARYTANPKAIAAGKKALQYLDTLGRPEGAQTWELPLHVPDILAAAYCVDAYLDAYLVTSEKRYLERARYWALSGLPFVYLWNAPDRPIMRYGTIPVFGVTWFNIQPWFGVAVQWNGLEYARALLRLAPYEPRTDWFKIGEGITQCAVQQMEYITREYPEHAGMYPDAYSPVKGQEEYHWDLNPRLLAINLLMLNKANPLPHTARSRFDGSAVSVTTVGDLSPATISPDDLAFSVGYHVGHTSAVIVAGIDRPAEVTVDGGALAEAANLSDAPSGWKHLTDHRLLLIKAGHTRPTTSFGIRMR